MLMHLTQAASDGVLNRLKIRQVNRLMLTINWVQRGVWKDRRASHAELQEIL